MSDILQFMLLLIKSEVCGCNNESENGRALAHDEIIEFCESEKSKPDNTFFARLYSLSNQYDLAHLVGSALGKAGLLPDGDIGARFKKQIMLAVQRYERMNYELSRICGVLSDARIHFVPLKGAQMRRYYPEEWMRTSCDIDILVHQSDSDRAVECLNEKLNYISDYKSANDISLYSASKVHIELHFDLMEGDVVSSAEKLLENVWEYAFPESDGSYKYIMTDEMFYFHHLVHAAKHIEGGGCGIRPFIDLWLLNHKKEYDIASRKRLLEQGGLVHFAEAAEKLSEVWFGDGEEKHNELTQTLQDYILNAGTYGSTKNAAAVQTAIKESGDTGPQRRKSKGLQLLWKPYDTLKYWYPSLEGRKWLLPFYQVKRWTRLITSGVLHREMSVKKYSAELEGGGKEKAKYLLKELGLIK